MNNPKSQKREIILLGPVGSGKTTYLATIAYENEKKMIAKLLTGLEVIPIGEEMLSLAKRAKNIIEEKDELTKTDLENGAEPYYRFHLKFPKDKKGLTKSSAKEKTPKTVLEFVARDFSGEFFELLNEKYANLKDIDQQFISNYLDLIFKVPAWQIMLTDWMPERDKELYQPVFKRLCDEIISRRVMNPEVKNLKIAIVMTKCERGELWPGRLNPEMDLFKVWLPNSYKILRETFDGEFNGNLKFFACSSFGILNQIFDSYNPRPNRYAIGDARSDKDRYYLRSKEEWQPFGLLAPLYWLATGRVFPDERI